MKEVKKCHWCGIQFDITQKERIFLDKISPVFPLSQPFPQSEKGVLDLGNGKTKYLFPDPTLCPECRRKKRLAWRNTSKLFKRKCDFSNYDIISFYDETVKHPVYDINIWDSDVWNPLDYGRDFDFNRSFFVQFGELKDTVPHLSRSVIGLENSDFSNNATNLKNCYLCFNGGEGEDSYYTTTFSYIKDCIDCFCVDECQKCYECVDVKKSHKLFFSQDCRDCSESYFLKNCLDCHHCFLCKNLINKKYVIFNKEYSQEEYKKIKEKLISENTWEELKKKFFDFHVKLPEKYMHSFGIENCSGDYIYDSSSVFESFDIMDAQDIFYSSNVKIKSKDLFDVDIFGFGLSRSYNSVVIGDNSSNIYCSYDCWENVENLYYCSHCIRNTNNCFGCVGLRGHSYCILNKQYTKEEYEQLVPQIIEHMQKTGEWGEFFPPTLSPYGYNQTDANLFYPARLSEGKKQMITEDGKRYEVNIIGNKNILCHSVLPNTGESESLEEKSFNQKKDPEINSGGQLIQGKSFNWSTYEAPFPKVAKIIPASKLPENIFDIPDDILNWAIEDEERKKSGLNPLFKIQKEELEFYRKHNLPIPKKHPDERHKQRMNLRNPRKLYKRNCDKCGKEIETTYYPERPEIVYCEECYNREIY